ncbi:MAG: hypothetical protein Kow0069_23670 [Promethearchaeota archaeon]
MERNLYRETKRFAKRLEQFKQALVSSPFVKREEQVYELYYHALQKVGGGLLDLVPGGTDWRERTGASDEVQRLLKEMNEGNKAEIVELLLQQFPGVSEEDRRVLAAHFQSLSLEAIREEVTRLRRALGDEG